MLMGTGVLDTGASENLNTLGRRDSVLDVLRSAPAVTGVYLREAVLKAPANSVMLAVVVLEVTLVLRLLRMCATLVAVVSALLRPLPIAMAMAQRVSEADILGAAVLLVGLQTRQAQALGVLQVTLLKPKLIGPLEGAFLDSAMITSETLLLVFLGTGVLQSFRRTKAKSLPVS